MIKKIFIITTLCFILIGLTSCTEYTKIHVVSTGQHFTIKSGHIFGASAYVTLSTGEEVVFSPGTFIGYNGKCPICEKE